MYEGFSIAKLGTEFRHHGNGRDTGESFGYWRLGKSEELAYRIGQ